MDVVRIFMFFVTAIKYFGIGLGLILGVALFMLFTSWFASLPPVMMLIVFLLLWDGKLY